MDWKEEIESSLVAKGMHRVKYLNDNLVEYCKEYVKYLDEFNGIRVTENRGSFLDSNRLPDFDDTAAIVIKINGLSIFFEFPDFTLSCYFDWERNLRIKYPMDINGSNFQREKKEEKVRYGFDVISVPKRVEKEFIFHEFNKRVKEYIYLLDYIKSQITKDKAH